MQLVWPDFSKEKSSSGKKYQKSPTFYTLKQASRAFQPKIKILGNSKSFRKKSKDAKATETQNIQIITSSITIYHTLEHVTKQQKARAQFVR